MCPEKHILSVYFDGELPAPFKARLDSHVEACTTCRATLASFTAMSAGVSDVVDVAGGAVDSSAFDDAMSKAKARIRERLTGEQGKNVRSFGFVSVLRRSVRVPFPIAAAASALIVFAFGVLFFSFGKLSTAGQMKNANRSDVIVDSFPFESFVIPEGAVSISDLSSYFDKTDADMFDISLPPEIRNFNSYGDPNRLPTAAYFELSAMERSRP
jgi:hypothetical protein